VLVLAVLTPAAPDGTISIWESGWGDVVMRGKLLISVVASAVDPLLKYQALAIGHRPSTPNKWGGR
jgi:hypothetical protein